VHRVKDRAQIGGGVDDARTKLSNLAFLHVLVVNRCEHRSNSLNSKRSENGSVGFKKCISTLLKFSPSFARSPITDDDERDLRSMFRRRSQPDVPSTVSQGWFND